MTDDELLPLTIRKIATVTEETLLESGRRPFQRTRLAAAMAVVTNPYAGRYVEDLAPMVDAYCPSLGTRLAELAVDLLDGEVESYGKAALVGEDGELEHGSALIHSLKFGNPFRDAAKGTALLPSAEKRGACGTPIDIAMKHKENPARRSHHWTFEVRMPDAPRANEILVICAGASSGRPLARIGGGPEDDDV